MHPPHVAAGMHPAQWPEHRGHLMPYELERELERELEFGLAGGWPGSRCGHGCGFAERESPGPAAPAPGPAPPTAPRIPKALRIFPHFRKDFASGTAVPLTPLNPGFIDPVTNTPRADPGLQKALEALIDSGYKILRS